MSVEDQRNGYISGLPITPMTQATKDAWIAQLESGSSNKALGKLIDEDDNNSRCALGHLLTVAGEGPDKVVRIPTELYKKIVELNDEQDLSLPEIAIWVKENVEVTDA